MSMHPRLHEPQVGARVSYPEGRPEGRYDGIIISLHPRNGGVTVRFFNRESEDNIATWSRGDINYVMSPLQNSWVYTAPWPEHVVLPLGV